MTRWLLFGFVLVALFLIPVWAQPIPPMPGIPEGPPGEVRPLRACPEVLRLGFDTPESEGTPFWGLVFWVKTDKPLAPFLAASFRDLAKVPDHGMSVWVDFDRDGKVDEFYPTGDAYSEKYPLDDICIEILPKVK